MSNRTACVFGGTGFLGRRVVRRLCEAGWAVRVAARRPVRPDGADGDRVELLRADVRDEGAVAAAVDGADVVVNAVSLYVETRDTSFDAIHAEGAERVARCARAAGVERLVHVSGIGADAASASRYVAARGAGEARVRRAFADATVLRPSVIFGADDAFLSALDTITRLPVVPLFGAGATRLQPVWVDDVAAAVARAFERQDTAGRVYELGGSGVYTYREIIDRVLRARGRRRWLLPVPFPVWRTLAGAASCLPSPPLTHDQVALMQADNVVTGRCAGFDGLGIEPASLEARLKECLVPAARGR